MDKTPSMLNDDAILLAGLAETLQRRLEEAHHSEGIDDALNLGWSFRALAQLAQTLGDSIAEFAS